MLLTISMFVTVDLQAVLMYSGWNSGYSDWVRAGRPRGRSSRPGRVKDFLCLKFESVLLY
jgi:hypothetical protein